MTITDPNSPRSPGQRPVQLGPVGQAVDACIRVLQKQFLDDRGEAVARVARIRRGAGRDPGQMPDLWGITGVENLDIADWSQRQAERAEVALYSAVTLWALHQQSHHEAPMYVRPGPGLGAAVAKLMPDGDIDEPIRRRFVRIGTSSSPQMLSQRLRDIVTLLRRDAIPLDYAELADQIHAWQEPARRAEVRRAWGRSFHAVRASGKRDSAGGTQAEPADNSTAHPTPTDEDSL
jgi:CRISPR system Cascade subunit CasB